MNKHVMIYVMAILFIITGVLYGEEMKFGKELTLKETTKISQLLETPDAFLNKTVKIEGSIVGVCARKGCWMTLAGDKDFQTLRIQVEEDGKIVFPMTAKGKTAIAEGELHKIVLNKKKVAEIKSHTCADNKKEAAGAEEGKVIYQFVPTGIVIK